MGKCRHTDPWGSLANQPVKFQPERGPVSQSKVKGLMVELGSQGPEFKFPALIKQTRKTKIRYGPATPAPGVQRRVDYMSLSETASFRFSERVHLGAIR